jgi:hypothetical protein
VKRTVDIPVTALQDWWIVHGHDGLGVNTCFGDSGGAVLRTGDDGVTRLVAVPALIWGSPGQDLCVDGYGWDLRVDLRADWIAETLAAWEPEPTDTAAATTEPAAPEEPAGCGCDGTGAGGAWAGAVAWLLRFGGRRRQRAEGYEPPARRATAAGGPT